MLTSLHRPVSIPHHLNGADAPPPLKVRGGRGSYVIRRERRDVKRSRIYGREKMRPNEEPEESSSIYAVGRVTVKVLP